MSVNYSQVYAAYRGTTELGRIYEGDLLVWEKPQGDLTFRIWRSVPLLTQAKYAANSVVPVDMGKMHGSATVNTWMHDGYDRRVYTTKFAVTRSVGVNTAETQIDTAIVTGSMVDVRNVPLLLNAMYVARRIKVPKLRLKKPVKVNTVERQINGESTKEDLRQTRNVNVNLQRRLFVSGGREEDLSHPAGTASVQTVRTLINSAAAYLLAKVQRNATFQTAPTIFPIAVLYDVMGHQESWQRIHTVPSIMSGTAGDAPSKAPDMGIDLQSDATAIAEVYTPWKYPYWDSENNLVIRQAYSASLSSGTLTIN